MNVAAGLVETEERVWIFQEATSVIAEQVIWENGAKSVS